MEKKGIIESIHIEGGFILGSDGNTYLFNMLDTISNTPLQKGDKVYFKSNKIDNIHTPIYYATLISKEE